MDKIREFFAKDALAKHLGIELAEVSPGTAVATMTVGDEHLNAFGMAHGAAVWALADAAFETACNSHGTMAVALNVTISFLNPGGREKLTAAAREVSCSRRIGLYAIDVTNPAGELIATFQGTAYRKGDPIG